MSQATLAEVSQTYTQCIAELTVGLNEADLDNMAALARAATEVEDRHLQAILDYVTYAPTSAAHLGMTEEVPDEWTPSYWHAYGAANTVVRSNVIYRLNLTDRAATELSSDRVYMDRRHTSDVTGDTDRFRQAGSALLWGLARLAANQTVHRLTGEDNTPWGIK
jgi:hypothetical protein